MYSARSIAQATLEALLLEQAFRPLSESGGPAAEYAVETFAQTLVASTEKTRG
jgi:hypothetical protein